MPFGLSRFLTLIALLAAAGAAFARNEPLMLPLDAALKQGQSALRADVALRFGKESAAAADAALGTVEAHGVGDPYGAINTNAGGSRAKRSDAEVCQDAFVKAVTDLQAKAKALGANAVVGIVGNNRGMSYDGSTQYECRVGLTRSVVDLRGQIAR